MRSFLWYAEAAAERHPRPALKYEESPMRSYLALAALAVLSSLAVAQPLSTAFTFQGELINGADPASGLYDFRFALFDAATGGTQQGPQLCSDNISVSGGKVTVLLDFGAQFAGQHRFLEVQVRQDTGLSCSNPAGFVILAPRQDLTAAPNAVYSLNAASAATATNAMQLNGQSASFYTNAANLTGTIPSASISGTYSSALTLSSPSNVFTGNGAALTGLNAATITTGSIPDARLSTNVPRLSAPNAFGAFTNSFLGNVGIGTASPGTPLHVKGAQEGIRIDGTNIGAANQAFLSFRDAAGTRTGWVGDGSSLDAGIFLGSDAGDVALVTGGGRVLTATAAGDLSLGTSSGDYRHFRIGGGNSDGFLYGSFPALGDGIHMGYNYYYDAAGNGVIIHSDGGTSRLSLGYSTITLAIGLPNQAPVNVMAIDQGGATFQGTTHFNGVDASVVVGNQANFSTTGLFAVAGYNPRSTGQGYGVLGNASPNNWAVYAQGLLGASGTKSFRIDHPADPENKYLLHYCAEGPEPQNVYNGIVALDDRGGAVVTLPPYFASINKEPRYCLTPIGAPMPLLHIAEEVDGAALTEGNAIEPGQEVPTVSFRVAGGAPNGRVSWEVKALRNDRWVQAHGAPVEVEKQGTEKGTYQHPDLYGQPPEKAMHYRSPPANPTPAAQLPPR
jgi:hypothetical protein